MGAFIKLCGLDALPPGKGRVIRVGGRDVYVYNREGRIYAALEELMLGGAAAFPGAPPHSGSAFDVEQQDSPARARAHAAAVAVEVREDGVYVALDDAGAPVEIDRPARAF